MEAMKVRRGRKKSDSPTPPEMRHARSHSAASNTGASPLDMNSDVTVALGRHSPDDNSDSIPLREYGDGEADGALGPGNEFNRRPVFPSTARVAFGSVDPLEGVEPQLANDERLRADLETINRAFEARLESLRKAHHLAQQKVMTEARIRHQIPLDVNILMARVEEQHARDAGASEAMRVAAEIPEIRPIINSVENGVCPEQAPNSMPSSVVPEPFEESFPHRLEQHPDTVFKQ